MYFSQQRCFPAIPHPELRYQFEVAPPRTRKAATLRVLGRADSRIQCVEVVDLTVCRLTDLSIYLSICDFVYISKQIEPGNPGFFMVL